MIQVDCLLCRVGEADEFFQRHRVWQDGLWRLSVLMRGVIAGFAHLESKRHIPFITDLDGEEAATLGSVLASAARGIREATGADKVYVYVFGDRVAHLHFNLVPHHAGDALVGGRGLVSDEVPELDTAAHAAAAIAIERLLAVD